MVIRRLVTFSKYEVTLLAVKIAVFTLPQTKAATSGLELTNVSTMPENCCVAFKKERSRVAKHLLALD